MADQTGIEWCDSTSNPWSGCTKISPACDHCYAESLSKRAPKSIAQWGAGQPRRRTSEANWRKPLRWNARRFMECGVCGWRGECEAELIGCGACGSSDQMNDARRRVFCASLADVFDNEVDPQWRADLFALIHATPNLDWLLLTKRIGNAPQMIHDAILKVPGAHGKPWPNVWLGATICNQAEADRDIPKLLALPAAVRFLSIEPMLGAIDLKFLQYEDSEERDELGRIIANTRRRLLKWVIAGGESGPHARPAHPDWFRSLRDQCAAAGVAFMFKQWGEHAPNWLNDDAGNKILGSEWMDRMGKKAAGRLLDGIEHNEFPEVIARIQSDKRDRK